MSGVIPIIVVSNTTHGVANGNYDGQADTWTTDPVKGAGYYNYTDGLHTVSYSLSNFVGVIEFQATLLYEPTEADWFDIADSAVGDGVESLTESTFKNFFGNFVWIRARITNFSAGTINKVLYN